MAVVTAKLEQTGVVELAIQDYSNPMGVATYCTADDLPDSYKILAPIMEEIPKILDEVGIGEDGGKG
ncbi:MAG: hypothetical protein ACOX4R_06010 [Lentihominibacter sp.]